MERAVLRLTIEFSLAERPIQGWLEAEGGTRGEFVGLVDLVASKRRTRWCTTRAKDQ